MGSGSLQESPSNPGMYPIGFRFSDKGLAFGDLRGLQR